jgi:hypothetical protein
LKKAALRSGFFIGRQKRSKGKGERGKERGLRTDKKDDEVKISKCKVQNGK